MGLLRILVLAPDANPESIIVSLEDYRHAEAVAMIAVAPSYQKRV